MSDLNDRNRKQKRREFIQEYAYVEDYSLYYKPPKLKKDEQPQRGVVEIDLNNGTIQIV